MNTCLYPDCKETVPNNRRIKCDDHRYLCVHPGCGEPNARAKEGKGRAYCTVHEYRHSIGRDLDDDETRQPVAEYRVNKKGYLVKRNGNGTKIFQHREVMEMLLARPLLPGETVHHRNGVKTDNHPDNLELWVTHQPSGQRPADLVAWADEIYRRYGGKAS